MSKADYFEKENLKDEILKQISVSKYALTPAQLYNIDSIKSLCQPNEVRLQIREIKRRCNQLVKDGKLLDTEAPSDKQGEASGPYSINPNAVPVPKPVKSKPPRPAAPEISPKTIIKPIPKEKKISEDNLTPEFIKILLKNYRSLYGLSSPPGTIGEIYEVAEALLKDNKKIPPLRDATRADLGPSYDPNKIYELIIIFIGGYFTSDKIISAMESLDNKKYSPIESKQILSTSDTAKLRSYTVNLLEIDGFYATSINLMAALIQINNFISESGEPISSTKQQLSPEDITKQDIILIANSGNTTLLELAKSIQTPQWLIDGVRESKELQGFIADNDTVVKGIHKIYLEIQEEEKEISVPIDPRIILSQTLLDNMSSGNLTKEEKNIIYEARMIDPQLDKLSSYVLESKDYELTPIAVKLNENNGKLPLVLWQRISIHKQNGTIMEINKENLPVYHKLKFIINRIDSVTNRDDKELLTKLLFEFPQYNFKSLSPQLITLIDSYFNQLSQSPVSSFNKDDIAKKLSLLDSITLSDSDKRIVSNMRSVLDANMIQKANTLVIDNILHQNAKKLPKTDTIDLGKSDYSEITFITPISKEEKLLNSISSRITISSAPKVSHMVREILSLREDLIEELYNDLLSGKDTEVNEGLIYLYHKDLIPPLIYETIRNTLIRK